MTPAEKRLKELIDRWLTSIELHLQYSALSDEAYWKVQSWPKHDRPTRWVLESAKQKANELKEVFESRRAMGDSKFADALELMNFLANLVGAQHVDRFVPLAEPKEEMPMPTTRAPPASTSKPPTSDVPSWYAQAHAAQTTPPTRPIAPKAAPASTPATPKPEPPRRAANDPDPTREMPKFRNQPASSATPPRSSAPAKAEPRKAQTGRATAPATKASPVKTPAPADETHQTVIADAVRLLTWGRTWHELAELIARMADRPPLGEVRKILRTHRAAIEKTAEKTAKA